MSVTDPELPSTVLFQDFRAKNCGILALEGRDLKA